MPEMLGPLITFSSARFFILHFCKFEEATDQSKSETCSGVSKRNRSRSLSLSLSLSFSLSLSLSLSLDMKRFSIA